MKQSTIFIIAGVAAAALIGGIVVSAMPQMTAAPQQPQTQPTTTADPRGLQPGDPGTLTPAGQEIQEDNKDPVFVSFKNTMDGCITGGTKPGTTKQMPATCEQIITQGLANWCGVGENYDKSKCEEVTAFQQVYNSGTGDLLRSLS